MVDLIFAGLIKVSWMENEPKKTSKNVAALLNKVQEFDF